MYERILVTFDGSTLSEQVLPYATEFARVVGPEEVVLLSAVEERDGRTLHIVEGYLGSLAGRMERAWQEADVARSPRTRCVAVKAPYGQVGGLILRFAEENDMSLVMMMTHGASGIDRWVIGSVAEKVLRGSDTPVFLVRASHEPLPKPMQLQQILAPLDGSELAEMALPYVESVAKAASAQVTLLYVERLPEDGKEATVHRGEEVGTYLASLVSGLTTAGVKAKYQVRTGQPDEQIAEEAEVGKADLVVMSSHGRTGIARWTFGSVADRVVHSSLAPVLLVKASPKGVVPEHLRGPLVYRCHNCGRRTYRETFTQKDRCGRCDYFLKACGNCGHFNGAGCLLQLPYASDTYPGNRCPQFEFRKARLILR